MNNISTVIHEEGGVNWKVALPKFKALEVKVKQDNVSVSDMLSYIMRMDHLAVSLYYNRNCDHITEFSDLNVSILNQNAQELIYKKEGWVKDESILLKNTLISIAEEIVNEVEKFLKQWDNELSGESLELVDVMSKEKRSNGSDLRGATFIPVKNYYQLDTTDINPEVEIYDAKVIFGRQQGTRTLQFHGYLERVLELIRSGTEVNMRGRMEHTNHIYGGREYGSDVTKVTAVFRSRVPEILKRKLLNGNGALKLSLMKTLCEKISVEKISLGSLEKLQDKEPLAFIDNPGKKALVQCVNL